MPIIEQSSQELSVPPKLPTILKQFCKAAIRTQPYDLLKWSSAYFRALADGEDPPTKMRLEYPPPCTASGLTLGFLRVLLRQFGDYNKVLSVETILQRWDCLCLDRQELNLIMMIGKFKRRCQVKKFLAIAVGLLGSSLFETMVMICELFTHEPDGGSAMIPATLFMELYAYLAGLRCDGSARDPSDEDPTEFVLCDSSDNTISSRVHESSSNKIRVPSTTSQDTEADIDIDLDSASKKDIDSPKSHPSRHLTESGTEQEETSDDGKQSTKNKLLTKESDEVSNSDDKSNQSIEPGEEESRQIESTDDRKILEDNEKKFLGEKVKRPESGSLKKKIRIRDTKLLTRSPNIPGIGPRLSVEEVATVAVWISECARCQEGMIGPRNLRHFQCPPLDRETKSDS